MIIVSHFSYPLKTKLASFLKSILDYLYFALSIRFFCYPFCSFKVELWKFSMSSLFHQASCLGLIVRWLWLLSQHQSRSLFYYFLFSLIPCESIARTCLLKSKFWSFGLVVNSDWCWDSLDIYQVKPDLLIDCGASPFGPFDFPSHMHMFHVGGMIVWQLVL